MTRRGFIFNGFRAPASRWRLLMVLFVTVLVQACAGNDNRGPRNSEDAAQYNAQLGAQYLQRGDLDQAREKLTKALEQDDDNALAHVTYAKLQYVLSRKTALTNISSGLWIWNPMKQSIAIATVSICVM